MNTQQTVNGVSYFQIENGSGNEIFECGRASGLDRVLINGWGFFVSNLLGSASATAFFATEQLSGTTGPQLDFTGNAPAQINSGENNGATAVGFIHNTESFTTAGALLQEWQNNSVVKMDLDKDGLLYPRGGVRTLLVTDDVSTPPTDAELDTAFGTPATVGGGFIGVVDDNGAGNNLYVCVSFPAM
jgi:hypothetical protein